MESILAALPKRESGSRVIENVFSSGSPTRGGGITFDTASRNVQDSRIRYEDSCVFVLADKISWICN